MSYKHEEQSKTSETLALNSLLNCMAVAIHVNLIWRYSNILLRYRIQIVFPPNANTSNAEWDNIQRVCYCGQVE